MCASSTRTVASCSYNRLGNLHERCLQLLDAGKKEQCLAELSIGIGYPVTTASDNDDDATIKPTAAQFHRVTAGQHQHQPSANSYIYQRLDFDEGMWIYRNDLVREVPHESLLPVVLLYNAGQLSRMLSPHDATCLFYYKTALDLPSSSSPLLYLLNHALASYYYHQGRPETALQHLQQALLHWNNNKNSSSSEATKITSKHRYHLGVTYNAIGVAMYHETLMDPCKMYLEKAIVELSSARCCCCAPLLATVYNNLGRAHAQLDSERAVTLYQQSYALRGAVLGPTHLDTAATAFNVGQSLHKRGQLHRALQLYGTFYDVATQHFGDASHRDVAVVLSGMAQIHHELGNPDEAHDFYEESLAVGREALGSCHPEMATLLNRVGNFYLEQGEHDRALVCYQEGLDMDEKTLPATHSNIIITLCNMGEIYRLQTDYSSSLEMYGRALELQLSRYGADHLELAGTYHSMGMVQQQAGDVSVALKSLNRAVEIRRFHLGSVHLDVAATLMHQGILLFRQGQTQSGLGALQEALSTRVELLGLDHRDVSFSRYNVALCHQALHQNKAAIACLTEALRVERLVLGNHHKDVGMTLYKLAQIYQAEGNISSALELYDQALRVCSTSSSDPVTSAKILHTMANLYLQQNDAGSSMRCFQQAARLLVDAGLSPSSIMSDHLRLVVALAGEMDDMCAAAA